MYVKKLETRSNGRKRNEVVALQMNVMIWQMPLFWLSLDVFRIVYSRFDPLQELPMMYLRLYFNLHYS